MVPMVQRVREGLLDQLGQPDQPDQLDQLVAPVQQDLQV